VALTLAKHDLIESLAERLHELAGILTADRIECQRGPAFVVTAVFFSTALRVRACAACVPACAS
jgi:hypothetical protein